MGNVGILTHVRLTNVEAQMLKFIAERAGEIEWDWSECRPDVASMMRGLVDKGMVFDLAAAGRIRLTDQGRSAVSQIDQALGNAKKVIST